MQSNNENRNDEWEREIAEEEADRLRKSEPPPKLCREEFLLWRSPRTVGANPTGLDNPLWHWLARTRWDAYNANNLYSGPSAFDAGPMWTFQRFGMSETTLPNGSVVYIGGEHEDHYDPDFFIYNDVTVIDHSGNIAIHGYPVEAFQPTDFHSATRVGDELFIIGCLGYPDRRMIGVTPVYKLLLSSMRIQAIETRGEPPGWIYKHTATLAEDGRSIIVKRGERWLGNDRATIENIDAWEFNTQSGYWRRLTKHKWQRWTMRRVDRKPNRLWDIRQALWNHKHAHLALENHWAFKDKPDFVALAMLYRLSEETPPPSNGPGFNDFSVEIDGLRVRFRESRFWVEAIVEGELMPERLSALRETTLALLERLEAAPWEIEGGTVERKA